MKESGSQSDRDQPQSVLKYPQTTFTVNLALRQSFLSSGSGDAAYGIFIAYFVLCLALTWAVYLRPSPRKLEGV